jgi:undecaprenyl-diphosphatase
VSPLRPGRSLISIPALAGFLLLTVPVAARWPALTGLDARINRSAYRFGQGHSGWVEGWRLVTHAGDTWFQLTVWALISVVLATYRRYRELAGVTAAVIGTQLVFQLVRWLIARPRPVLGFTHPTTFSYPSSHTTGATTGAVLLVLLLWPWRRLRPVAVPVAICWAGLVGVSRVALGAHWPTDVLAGWLLPVALIPPLFAAGLVLGSRLDRRVAAPPPGHPDQRDPGSQRGDSSQYRQ